MPKAAAGKEAEIALVEFPPTAAAPRSRQCPSASYHNSDKFDADKVNCCAAFARPALLICDMIPARMNPGRCWSRSRLSGSHPLQISPKATMSDQRKHRCPGSKR